MQLHKWVFRLVIASLIVVAFFAGSEWGRSEVKETPVFDCSELHLSGEFATINRLLREFDDKVTLAINIPREEVVDQVEGLQQIRRDIEAMQVRDCLGSFRLALLAYMDQMVNLLVAFTGGVSPSLVFQGLEDTVPLRLAMEAEIATLTGVSPTPYPTPFQFESLIGIPVTGLPTATNQPSFGLATVIHGEGVNVREGPGVTFGFQVVLPPSTQAVVLGKSADSQWIFLESAEYQAQGWVFLPLLSLESPIDLLPVVGQVNPAPAEILATP